MRISKNRSRIVADDELDAQIDDINDDVDVDVDVEDTDVSVDPEATELLFETEDVAELIAEVTAQPVDVTVEDSGEVTFAVGDAEFTVTPDGDEELVESSRKIARSKKAVKASAAKRVRRPARVAASTSARRPVKSAKIKR